MTVAAAPFLPPGDLADVSVTVRDQVAWIVLNRPERRNALTPEMMADLARELDELATDAAVRAAVLTGAGSAFCAGGDVASLDAGRREGTGAARRARLQTGHAAVSRLHRFPNPTIAAINGAAVGGGLALALACDLRVMAATATLRPGYARVGLPGDLGGSWFLSQLIGPAAARRIYLLDEPLGAAAALRLGIVDRVAEEESFPAETGQLAARLASGPTRAFALAKATFAVAATSDLETTMETEMEHHLIASETEDHRRALKAFAARRPPIFIGR